ncbi:MAG: hypothetical protein GEU77_18985 [Deltaproteobacteria bacterium]|nr:hypothetical protein [Deltaproteobacteria bacterium]
MGHTYTEGLLAGLAAAEPVYTDEEGEWACCYCRGADRRGRIPSPTAVYLWQHEGFIVDHASGCAWHDAALWWADVTHDFGHQVVRQAMEAGDLVKTADQLFRHLDGRHNIHPHPDAGSDVLLSLHTGLHEGDML